MGPPLAYPPEFNADVHDLAHLGVTSSSSAGRRGRSGRPLLNGPNPGGCDLTCVEPDVYACSHLRPADPLSRNLKITCYSAGGAQGAFPHPNRPVRPDPAKKLLQESSLLAALAGHGSRGTLDSTELRAARRDGPLPLDPIVFDGFPGPMSPDRISAFDGRRQDDTAMSLTLNDLAIPGGLGPTVGTDR